MSLMKNRPKELVEFKGNKRGIIVNINNEASFDEIKETIIEKIGISVGFFNGAKIDKINCDFLNDIQILELKDHISSRFDIEFLEDEIKKENKSSYFETKYVTNLRSGESIDFEGDVIVMSDMNPGSQVNSLGNTVVMGDINAGARVVAGGNVIVMGKVSGFIHAGSNGNKKAYVIANHLVPRILQIENNMAEAPDEDIENNKENNPEIAFINEGRIVIESYLPKTLK